MSLFLVGQLRPTPREQGYSIPKILETPSTPKRFDLERPNMV